MRSGTDDEALLLCLGHPTRVSVAVTTVDSLLYDRLATACAEVAAVDSPCGRVRALL